jgi:hypothetical protein
MIWSELILTKLAKKRLFCKLPQQSVCSKRFLGSEKYRRKKNRFPPIISTSTSHSFTHSRKVLRKKIQLSAPNLSSAVSGLSECEWIAVPKNFEISSEHIFVELTQQ